LTNFSQDSQDKLVFYEISKMEEINILTKFS